MDESYPVSDNEIMLRVQEGELDHMSILFTRYQRMLMGYFIQLSGNRETAKDLTQDTFLRILRYRLSFQQQHHFKSWMFQIARNIFHDHCRQHSKLRVAVDRVEDTVNMSEDTKDLVQNSEAKILLARAMEQLSPAKREVLVLSRFEELKYSEIASILGCSVSNVKIKVFRALQDLRANYQLLAGGNCE